MTGWDDDEEWSPDRVADTVLITVFCDDASHAPREAKVAMFTDYPEVDPPAWDIIASFDFTDERHSDVVLESRVLLVGTETAPDQLLRHPRIPADTRIKFKLICPLCGLAVTVRDDKLNPLFNAMAPHATVARRSDDERLQFAPPRAMRVPLGWLAAKVSST